MEVEVEEPEDSAEAISVSVRTFVSARIDEIVSISNQLANEKVCGTGGTRKTLAFQHVPKHMRRRAVSHNPKRLPARLRVQHLNQVEKSSGIIKKPKRPSRKFRRKKSNLLEEYNRRQRKVKWIETHIWHAKRFHMEEKWGYKIPISPCDKGYRAIYRAFTKYTAMRDISFYSCLQIKGDPHFLSSCFKENFCPPEVNRLSISALKFIEGGREGKLYFYKEKSYPYNFIGQISFFWQRAPEDETKSLFLWIPPSFKEEIFSELVRYFSLDYKVIQNSKKDKKLEIDTPSNEKEKNKELKESIDQIKLYGKLIDNQLLWSNQSSTISLIDLEGHLNRIRLFGPESLSVIKEVCRPSLSYQDSTEISKLICNFPTNAVIPLSLRDPRLFLPQKRTKSKTEIENDIQNTEEYLSKISSLFNSLSKRGSPLFDHYLRRKIVEEKMSDLEFSHRRSQLLIPGSFMDLKDDENQVPVILIKDCENWGESWDIIIPAGWAMSFWVAFSYRAARACGLRDAIHYQFEAGIFSNLEIMQQDSASGIENYEIEENKKREEYFKLPPAKRENYIKMGNPFPFQINWKFLLNFWNNNKNGIIIDEFFILRDQSLINLLQNYLKSKQENILIQIKSHPLFPSFIKCLIATRITIIGKGNLSANSVICIPNKNDFLFENTQVDNSNTINKKFKISKNSEIDFLEPLKTDENVQKREELKKKHQKFLAFLRKKRKKLKKKSIEDGIENMKERKLYDSSQVSKKFNLEINSLWLPSDPGKILKEMTRLPIGFIIIGGETYIKGKCTGLALCSLEGLLKWKESSETHFVLVRNCKESFIYRMAKIEICEM